jgi:hypothetical protein
MMALTLVQHVTHSTRRQLRHDVQLQKDPSIPHHSVFTSETAFAEKEHVGCQLEHQT